MCSVNYYSVEWCSIFCVLFGNMNILLFEKERKKMTILMAINMILIIMANDGKLCSYMMC